MHEAESTEHASILIRKTYWAEQIAVGQEIILHSDNGSPMKGANMLATLQKLGVIPSFSRPSVSNDNPYSESLFKTLKYRLGYPSKPFSDIDTLREWVQGFVKWYNTEHKHSALRYVTPLQRHTGEDITLLQQRTKLYQQAKAKHPERWSKNECDWSHQNEVWLNPSQTEKPHQMEVKSEA